MLKEGRREGKPSCCCNGLPKCIWFTATREIFATEFQTTLISTSLVPDFISFAVLTHTGSFCNKKTTV